MIRSRVCGNRARMALRRRKPETARTARRPVASDGRYVLLAGGARGCAATRCSARGGAACGARGVVRAACAGASGRIEWVIAQGGGDAWPPSRFRMAGLASANACGRSAVPPASSIENANGARSVEAARAAEAGGANSPRMAAAKAAASSRRRHTAYTYHRVERSSGRTPASCFATKVWRMWERSSLRASSTKPGSRSRPGLCRLG